jgi:hybrid cluster-associated redox disulfide protein
MDTVAVIVAVVALLFAYLAMHRANLVDQRLAEVATTLVQTRTELGEMRAQLEAHQRDATTDARRKAGTLKFLPTMTIKEAMELHPGVNDVLASFQLSGCSNCAISDVDTLEGACRTYGIDEKTLMSALARLAEPAAAGDLLQMARAGRN